ncbi:MAG: AAA family ATPase [Edaphocola sp.]
MYLAFLFLLNYFHYNGRKFILPRRLLGTDKTVCRQAYRQDTYRTAETDYRRNKKSENANIIYIDKEQERFSDLNNHTQLYDYVKNNLSPEKNNFVFIDEIQEIDEFQKCLRSLLNEQLCDIYCTGSNANMLSGELATQLAGRYVAFAIHSLSYTELLNFNQLEDSNESLERYLTIGRMPYQHNIGTESAVVFEYLKNVYASILLKDVVSRENIRNVLLLENLIAFLADNTGSLFSAQNISKHLQSQQIKIPTQTVINYLKALTNAYFIHETQRADIKVLNIFKIL